MRQSTLFKFFFGVFALALAAAPALLADSSATAEPKVMATIQPASGHPEACLVAVEVRLADSDQLLAAAVIQVSGGQSGGTTTTNSNGKVTINVKAGAGCGGGTYTVKVFTGGKLAGSRSGGLERKGK